MSTCQWSALTRTESCTKKAINFRYSAFASEESAKIALQKELYKIGSEVLEVSSNPYKFKTFA